MERLELHVREAQAAGARMPSGGPVSQPDPFVGVWLRLWKGLPVPNPVKVFAWRLLHGALPCRAMQASLLLSRDRSASWCGCCPSVAAEGAAVRAAPRRPETLTHLFLECPAFAGAVTWLQDVWEALSGQRPPATLEVIVAGQPGAWPGEPSKGSAAADRWHALRLTLLYHIWAARCSNDAQQRSARAVVVATVDALRADIRLQFNRAFCGRELQRYLPPGVMAMRRLAAARHTFAVWDHPLLACVRQPEPPLQPWPPLAVEPSPLLELVLDVDHPVPAPAVVP